MVGVIGDVVGEMVEVVVSCAICHVGSVVCGEWCMVREIDQGLTASNISIGEAPMDLRRLKPNSISKETDPWASI